MKYDIYYILEKWAPDLTKNKIYQKLIKEIIPLEDSYKVSDTDQEEKYIDINPTEDGKTIRVNPIGKDEKKKVEYSCNIDEGYDVLSSAIITLSEGENADLIYSYIEIYCSEDYNYIQTTTATISETEDNNYILKSIQTEKCIYDKDTIETFIEPKEGIDSILSVNNYADYTNELRRIIREGKEKSFIIPDLQLSIDIKINPENKKEYSISFDGHQNLPNKQAQCEVTPLKELSQKSIEETIRHLTDNSEIKEAWEEEVKNRVEALTSNNDKEINITEPSYNIDAFIAKTTTDSQVIKQKNRKDG